ESGRWRAARSAQLRSAFRERFCPYDDGHAAERIVRHVVFGETTPRPAVVPLSERHPAPAPQALDAALPGSDPAGLSLSSARLLQRPPTAPRT
ncbi:CDP-glycerol glycerophosphotransferase family protein, partial [Streptomyces sp. NBC_01283]|uniref:CDP-glycerol glycerophosphotransferase family protein n=1 Tax=Streptomyces sp. NBC_01283 TaxID=2903812 RepID=UPI00352FC1C4